MTLPDVPADITFVYFAPADIQVPRVDRQGIVHFCEAVHRLGVETELVALGIRLLDTEAATDHPLDPYRIRERFPVRIVPTTIDQRTQDNRVLHSAWTRLRVNIAEGLRYLRRVRRGRGLVFFVKNYGPAAAFLVMQAFTRRRLLVLFEAHVPPRRALHRAILKRVDGIIANSHALGDVLVREHGIPAHRVLGTHQGIDLELVEATRVERDEARRALDVPVDARVVVYAGKIYWEYREVEHILAAARLLADDVRVILVGGRADHVERYRDRLQREGPRNVTFTGFVAPVDVQVWLAAADVLVMYYPSGIELNRFRSPGKLFEYMAARRPIVAADYSVLHEVLGEEPAALTIPPDDPSRLAAALTEALKGGAEIDAMAQRAYERVRLFSWEARARIVMGFVDGLMKAKER